MKRVSFRTMYSYLWLEMRLIFSLFVILFKISFLFLFLFSPLINVCNTLDKCNCKWDHISHFNVLCTICRLQRARGDIILIWNPCLMELAVWSRHLWCGHGPGIWVSFGLMSLTHCVSKHEGCSNLQSSRIKVEQHLVAKPIVFIGDVWVFG